MRVQSLFFFSPFFNSSASFIISSARCEIVCRFGSRLLSIAIIDAALIIDDAIFGNSLFTALPSLPDDWPINTVALYKIIQIGSADVQNFCCL
jgi:hypothetical protein